MYLSPAEYADYGIPDATSAQVLAASRRIDAELGRPEGLLYGTDADSLPAYMLGLPATATYTLSDPVVAGLDTEITVTDATLTPARIGDIALIDRAGQCEAATITRRERQHPDALRPQIPPLRRRDHRVRPGAGGGTRAADRQLPVPARPARPSPAS